MQKNKLKRAFALSLALSAMLSVPAEMSAQGLFGGPQSTNNDNSALLNSGDRGGEGMEWDGGGMVAQDPTEQAPIGGGLMLLMAAGAGYAIVKSKNGKEEQK